MILEFCLLIGLLAVASNPTPYYAALGLVGGSGVGCLMLAKGGASFLSLVLFLVYLGGIMVVFAYCAALVAEPYPEAWGSRAVIGYLGVYGLLLLLMGGMYGWSGGVKVLSSISGVDVGCGEW